MGQMSCASAVGFSLGKIAWIWASSPGINLRR